MVKVTIDDSVHDARCNERLMICSIVLAPSLPKCVTTRSLDLSRRATPVWWRLIANLCVPAE